MRTRPAAVADVPRVVTLVESAYRGDASREGWTTEADLLDGQRTDAAAVTDAVTRTDAVVLVVEDDLGSVVACCQIERHHDGGCHFGMFAVDPKRQAQGIGDRLLATAEAEARERYGADRLELTVIAQRAELIAWYERRGYRRTGATASFPYGDERFGRPRRDDLYFVVMSKPLG